MRLPKLLGCLVIMSLPWSALRAQVQEQRVSRNGVPDWKLDAAFERDAFTFVRVQYRSFGGGWRWGPSWQIDFPEADLNLSFRLSQVTSMVVHPEGRTIELTDASLNDSPFIYIVEPGRLYFTETEVQVLRDYLTGGGFLMVDDFWGQQEWDNFYFEIKRVFPEREPEELPLEHPIFNIVFPLTERPQVPNLGQGMQSQWDGVTWEPRKGPGAREVHYRAIFDDQRRMMVMICHNTDLGDGWEEEGEDEYYFREFAEKKAYPLGINILFYAMTH